MKAAEELAKEQDAETKKLARKSMIAAKVAADKAKLVAARKSMIAAKVAADKAKLVAAGKITRGLKKALVAKKAKPAKEKSEKEKMYDKLKDLVSYMKQEASKGVPRSNIVQIWNKQLVPLLNLYGAEYLDYGAGSEMSDEWWEKIEEILDANVAKAEAAKAEAAKRSHFDSLAAKAAPALSAIDKKFETLDKARAAKKAGHVFGAKHTVTTLAEAIKVIDKMEEHSELGKIFADGARKSLSKYKFTGDPLIIYKTPKSIVIKKKT